jgi:uncharacterized membrane protein
MKTKLRLFSVLALLIVGLIAVSGIANADSVPVVPGVDDVQVQIEEVQVDGEALDDDELRGEVARGDTVEVKVKLLALADDDDVVVEASVEGLDHDTEKAEDETDAFSVKAGKTYYKSLTLALPDRMDIDQYALRIEVSNRDDDEVIYNAILDIEQPRNSIMIKDVVFSPENSVKAGRALLTSVRIKNMGEDEEDDVKVQVSIPELGISASDYIDELEEDDSVTSEELYMRIPECADAGEYTATVKITYDEGDESVSKDYVITVIGSDVCNVGANGGKTVVTVGSDVQDVVAGESGVVYPITLSNTGSVAKTYTVSAVGGDWAEIKVSPNVVVLGPEETKIVYVSVAAKEDAAEGEKTFGVAIKSGDATLKEVTLKANVVEDNAGWSKVKKGLEVALVVLVVLLVIIGLIIGFNRLKGDEDEEAKEETYY